MRAVFQIIEKRLCSQEVVQWLKQKKEPDPDQGKEDSRCEEGRDEAAGSDGDHGGMESIESLTGFSRDFPDRSEVFKKIFGDLETRQYGCEGNRISGPSDPSFCGNPRIVPILQPKVKQLENKPEQDGQRERCKETTGVSEELGTSSS